MEEFKFDFEHLKVYQKVLKFIDKVFEIIKDLPKEYRYSIGSNLLRAALSVSNNIAEGNDKVSQKEKLRYFRISSDSARECVSVFIVLNRQSLLADEIFWKLKSNVREITSMLRGFSG
ncbi:MAG: four helix bundle protein [Candidatus Omnitrophica bacterium]|nr:four helix bundle protein [Candidatus Omnitrophota bacterium]